MSVNIIETERGALDSVGSSLRSNSCRTSATGTKRESARIAVFARSTLESVERAKTAMRALSRFVPVALVRQLFERNEEPTLSSAPRSVSMMFTDIEGFTTLVEREEPLQLAKWLGDYFAA